MADPTFLPAERRSYALPILVAVALLALAAYLTVRRFPSTHVEATHLHTEILPTHTVFKSNSIVVGPPESSDSLFVATTVRLDNKLRTPTSLDGVTCTLTDPSGGVLTVKAVTHQDLASVESSFPALKPLMATPLPLEANLDAGQSTQGTVLLAFPFTREQWDARKSATLQIAIYHQHPTIVEIPKP